MVRRQPPSPDDVGRVYDEFTDVWAEALGGGNVHLGVWDDEGTGGSAGQAADHLTDLVADRLDRAPGDRLLDVGCGDGRPALRVAHRLAVHVTGITVSGHQLAQAKDAERRPLERGSVGFQFADAMKLPFPDASFDAAFAIESLLHMSDLATVLDGLRRVVAPGGRLVVADLLLRGPVTGEAEAAVTATAQMFQVSAFASPDDFHRLLEGSGWAVDDLTDIGERIRPSYDHVTATMRSFADAVEEPMAGRIRTGADLVGAFGALPEIGYVLLTAHRA